MNIHKFNVKPKTNLSKTIHWQPLREVKYPAKKINSVTWEIFSQENIKLKPSESKTLQLGLGYIMSEGVVLAALAKKNKRCSLQNEVSLENSENIVITITNDSNEIVNIEEPELLCRVCYKKI